MTAELEAVVVAAYVFADEYRPLHGAAPAIHRRRIGVRWSRESQTWRDGAWPYTRR